MTFQEKVDALIEAVKDMASEQFPYPSQVEKVKEARAAVLDADAGIASARERGYVVKSWCRDDILSIAEEDPEFDALTDDEKSRVLDYAEQDTMFRSLEDATDQDWDAISQAVDAGMVRVQAGQ